MAIIKPFCLYDKKTELSPQNVYTFFNWSIKIDKKCCSRKIFSFFNTKNCSLIC